VTQKSEYKAFEKSLADDGPDTRNAVLAWLDFIVKHVPQSEVWTIHVSSLPFVGPTQAKYVFTDRLIALGVFTVRGGDKRPLFSNLSQMLVVTEKARDWYKINQSLAKGGAAMSYTPDIKIDDLVEVIDTTSQMFGLILKVNGISLELGRLPKLKVVDPDNIFHTEQTLHYYQCRIYHPEVKS